MFGFHQWNGCKCPGCGKKRDEKHDWSKDCQKCAVCGKVRNQAHDWIGCECSKCGIVSRPDHNLTRLIASGYLTRWVREHSGKWNDCDWLALLESLRRSQFWPLQDSAISLALESEKKWLRIDPATVRNLTEIASSKKLYRANDEYDERNNSEHNSVIDNALKRLEELLVTSEDNQEALLQVAETSDFKEIQYAAVRKLTNHKLLIKIVSYHNYAGCRSLAAEKMLLADADLTNEEMGSIWYALKEEHELKWIAIKSNSQKIRISAIEKMKNPGWITNAAIETSCEITGCAAIDKIKDRQLLVKIAAEAKNSAVRHKAHCVASS